MDWSLFADRVVWLGLGLAIGTALGWAARARRDVRDMRDDERGAVTLQGVGLAVVVGLTAFAAFAAEGALDRVEESQTEQRRLSTCNREVVASLTDALASRDEANRDAQRANLRLLRAQRGFLTNVIANDDPGRVHLTEYVNALDATIRRQQQQMTAENRNPLPLSDQFDQCLDHTERDTP